MGNEVRKSRGVTRRKFITTSATATLAAAIPKGPLWARRGQQSLIRQTGLTLVPDFELEVLRKDDQLALTLGFVNLAISNGGTRLAKKNDRETAYIVVTHGPQHVLEEAYEEIGSTGWQQEFSKKPSPPPIPSRISGTSRVVFIVPSDVKEMNYELEAVLEAMGWFEMNVASNAAPPDPPPPSVLIRRFQNISALRKATGALGRILRYSPSQGMGTSLPRKDILTAMRAVRGYEMASHVSGVQLLAGALSVERILQQQQPRMPASGETALEVPFRLIISPHRLEAWAHSQKPVKSAQDRIELWHTRLGMRPLDAEGRLLLDAQSRPLPADESPSYYRTVRAVWTRDAGFSATMLHELDNMPEDPFLASLKPKDRQDIVHESSNIKLAKNKPKPINVNRLMLTSMGAWVDLRGDWGDETDTGLALWEHKATFGRDHYVKVVRNGVLIPFGIPASLLTITERKFKHDTGDSHPHIAYLRQRKFIVLKKPVVQYESERTGPSETEKTLRKNPFVMVNVKTLVTPDLDGSSNAFWPKVGGEKFPFACEALDLAGNLIKFATPLFYVSTEPDDALQTRYKDGCDEFNSDDTMVPMNGQRIAYAPPSERSPDDTTYETNRLRFKGQDFTEAEALSAGYTYPFLPYIDEAELAVEAARQLTGVDATSLFQYDVSYVNSGFGPDNIGEVILKKSDGDPIMDFSPQTDKSGGLVAPSLDIKGLSRKIGPVAGNLDNAAKNLFNPADFFGGVDAKLFGTINLFDIIPAGKLLKQAPAFITQALNAVESFIQLANKLQEDVSKAIDAASGAAQDASTSAHSALEEAKELVDALKTLMGDVENLVNAETADFDAKLRNFLDDDITKLKTKLPKFMEALPALGELLDGQKQVLLAAAQQLQGIIDADHIEELIQDFAKGMDMAKNLHVRLEWKPNIGPYPHQGDKPYKADDAIFLPSPTSGKDADTKYENLTLELDARGKDLPGQPAGVSFLCSLDKFKLQLIPPMTFMILDFEKVQLRVESGKKPDVDVRFNGLVFAGPLAFVEELRKLIPLTGFSDPPSIDVTSAGVSASFDMPIPSVAVGVFSLRNLTLGAGFEVPFIGKPLTVSFNFCTRESPFELTVSMLGGGGYFGLTVSPTDVQLLEAALEFGASLAMDFGVASGSVEVKGGIYFKMENDNVNLSGYVRIRGEVDVLGLISASLEMYMVLNYQSAGNKMVGKATIEIEVDLFLFSFSVKVSAEEKFSGESADPSFAQIMAPDKENNYYPWDEYLGAFAEAA